MISLILTAMALNDPKVCIAANGSTIATFLVEVREEHHVPPSRIEVVAIGAPGSYAQKAIRKGTLVLVSGWFYIKQNVKGNEFVQLKAQHVRALVV